MDRESLHRAETRVNEMQDVLESLQHGIQSAERAQEAAERNAAKMRNIALAALGLTIVIVLVGRIRARRRKRD